MEQVNTNLAGTGVNSIAVNASGDVFCSVSRAGVFRSGNNGDSWSAVPTGLLTLNVNPLTSPRNPKKKLLQKD